MMNIKEQKCRSQQNADSDDSDTDYSSKNRFPFRLKIETFILRLNCFCQVFRIRLTLCLKK